MPQPAVSVLLLRCCKHTAWLLTIIFHVCAQPAVSCGDCSPVVFVSPSFDPGPRSPDQREGRRRGGRGVGGAAAGRAEHFKTSGYLPE